MKFLAASFENPSFPAVDGDVSIRTPTKTTGFVFSSLKNVTSCCTPSSNTAKSPFVSPEIRSFFCVTVTGKRTSNVFMTSTEGVGVGVWAYEIAVSTGITAKKADRRNKFLKGLIKARDNAVSMRRRPRFVATEQYMSIPKALDHPDSGSLRFSVSALDA